MGASLRLVVFDVDGTLVDSQADIITSMRTAFHAVDLDAPDRATILAGVGLSLEVLMPVLAPDATSEQHAQMVQAYKDAYMTQRKSVGTQASSPLYPGALECLQALHAIPEVLLGVATGKSKRGLDKLIEGHGLEHLFVTRQVADFHPSKPHPAMLQAALDDAGVLPAQAVMIGDTSFDMQMAASAGVPSIGVTWGYHGRDRLGQADCLVDSFPALQREIQDMWKENR